MFGNWPAAYTLQLVAKNYQACLWRAPKSLGVCQLTVNEQLMIKLDFEDKQAAKMTGV